MKSSIIAGLIALMPAFGWAASIPPYIPPPMPGPDQVVYWYLGAKPTLALPDGPRIERNQGYMVVDKDRAGQTATGAFTDYHPPFSSGPDLGAAFTLRGDDYFNFWDVTFDERGDPERWAFRAFYWTQDDTAVVHWREGDSYRLRLAPSDDPDVGIPNKLVFDAPPGEWYRREADYLAAAKEAGIVPVPLPAACWLFAAALGGLGLLRGRRHPASGETKAAGGS